MLDIVLFAACPYVPAALAVVGGIVRYYGDRFSFSSHSSQVLENRVRFWGSVSWHYGIIVVLLAHIGALAFSGAWGDLVANPTRLYTLEVIGIALGLLALLGLVALSLRRVLSARATVGTATSARLPLGLRLVRAHGGAVVRVAVQAPARNRHGDGAAVGREGAHARWLRAARHVPVHAPRPHRDV